MASIGTDRLKVLLTRPGGAKIAIRVVLSADEHIEDRNNGNFFFSMFKARLLDVDGDSGGSAACVFGSRGERDAALLKIREHFPDGTCFIFSEMKQVGQLTPQSSGCSVLMNVRYDSGKKSSMKYTKCLAGSEPDKMIPKIVEPKAKLADLPASIDEGRAVDIVGLVLKVHSPVNTVSGTKQSLEVVDESKQLAEIQVWRAQLGDLSNLEGKVIYVYNLWAGPSESSGKIKPLSNPDETKGGTKAIFLNLLGPTMNPEALNPLENERCAENSDGEGHVGVTGRLVVDWLDFGGIARSRGVEPGSLGREL